MVASGTGIRCEVLAQSLFEAISQFCLAVPRARRQPGELKEIEYLALALLRQHEPQIVGDLQRQLAILPAQMSRVIRALEDRQPPLIACRINTADKRKIDVILTDDGARACLEHQGERIAAIAGLLARLPEEDLDALARLIERFRDLIDALLADRRDTEEPATNGSAHI